MKELIINFFNNFASIIIFLHIFSAIIWIGGMIAIRFAVHYAMDEINETKIKLFTITNYLKRFFNIVILAIVVILITAIILIIAKELKGTSLYPIVYIKEIIWSIMTINFIFIYKKRNKAQIFLLNNNFKEAKKTLAPIAKWMIPLNIVLGVFALFFGIKLNGY